MVCGQGCLSRLHTGGIKFYELGLQGQPYGSSISNIFEYLCTEEVTGVGKTIFEGAFKFASSEEVKKFDSTASEL